MIGGAIMAALRLSVSAIGAVALCTALFFASAVTTAEAAETCTSPAMYVAAHEDDTLLFQSPDLLRDVQSDHCVRTVFVTAGDAGKAAEYWEGREEGAEAAYAQMAGVANQWTGSQIVADGHSIHLETLKGQPGISIAYMRLPDGGDSGDGTALYGFESLEKLWKKGNPGNGGPTIDSIEAVDGSNTYSYQGLIDTLAALMESFGPRQIATQNYTVVFDGPDHSDHVGTAYFTAEAQDLYGESHRLLAYEDYETASKPQNVFGDLLEAKSSAFYTYGSHDSDACASAGSCTGTSYAKWLLRQYVADAETFGVVAHAGYAQTAAASEEVTLDGSESSDESGDPLDYEWTQTGGPAVSLSEADTDSPSFVTPSHPTLLTFSLTVEDGSDSSDPDFVKVRVPGSDPTPMAIAGLTQTVASGATVSLDGSGSWDPNALPLGYSWTQVAGQPVGLTGSSTEKPSFTAPTGPASLRFSLVVSNGAESSDPATVTIDVSAPTVTPPSDRPGSEDDSPPVTPPGRSGPGSVVVPSLVRLSSPKVRLLIGRSSRHVVKVLGAARPWVECSGSLPRGATCRVTAERNVVVEGSGALKRVGTFHLTVQVTDHTGTVRRPLIVQVRRPPAGA
jgi:LmbE family N-acetylglucosaminyl deacetylase